MIQKTPSPKGKSVRVTFQLPEDVAAERVAVVGDFNGWNPEKDVMTLDEKERIWSKSISLKPGNTYQFRYFIDRATWRNDEEADGYAPGPFAADNGLISI